MHIILCFMDIDTISIKELKLNIAELTRKKRKQQGISRNDLAIELNISRITLQNLETGKNVTLDTLLKVFQHFELLNDFNHFIQEQSDNSSIKSLY